MNGGDVFFGELYLRSTRPFLSPDVTEREGAFLVDRLPNGRILDLGCGHGRHLASVPGAYGVDRDQLSLLEAKKVGHVTRGDFARLPWRDAVFDGVYCWYNTLGTFEDAAIPPILAEVGRVTRRGGRLIIQASHPGRARAQPEATYDGPIGQGDHLREWARYDAEKGRDEMRRELTLADGRVMEARFFIRYYDLDQWRALVGAAGFEVQWWMGAMDGSPVEETSTDVIFGAVRK